jgi:inosine/xanthosine triphosphate pyrophosphatase family protein
MDSTRSRGFSVEFRMKLTGNADRPGLGIKWDGMIVEDSALGVEGLNNTPGVGL